MSQDNVGVVRGMYASFAEGDVPSVLETMDPQVEWNEAENFPYADGNPYVGPSAVAEGVFKRLGDEWEYWSLTTDQFLDAGDSVVVLGRYGAAHKQTGKKLDAQFAHVWWLRNGKVMRFQQYTDTAQTQRAMRA
jgi:ketosteroid isomerase-like protein